MSKPNFGFLSPQQAPSSAVSCPHCHQPIRLVPELAGAPVPCPYCRKQVMMPGQTVQMQVPAPQQPQVYQPASLQQSRPNSTAPPKAPPRKKNDPTLLYIIGGVLVTAMLGATVYAISETQKPRPDKRPARQAVKLTPDQQRQQIQAVMQIEAELAREQQQQALQQQALQQQALQEQLQIEQSRRAAARAQQNFNRALPGGPGRGFRP